MTVRASQSLVDAVFDEFLAKFNAGQATITSTIYVHVGRQTVTRDAELLPDGTWRWKP